MAIGPVELNGIISRTQDYAQVKHNEDNHGVVSQQNFQTRFEKEVDERLSQVNRQEAMRKEERRFDAREKGDNEYSGNGGSQRKNGKNNKDGKVIIRGEGSFDIKI